jgi:putative tryptophan/tyrosine transport system substrate-binding protein
MDRRAFIALLGAACTACPIRAEAHHSGDGRTVGILIGLSSDADTWERIRVIREALVERGWIEGQNLHIVYRFAGADPALFNAFARDLVALRPDVIVAHSTPGVAALHAVTQDIPIVFVNVADPLGSGFVASIARPGGNITGFSVMQTTIIGKYFSILRNVEPDLRRVAVLYNPGSSPAHGTSAMLTFKEAARRYEVEPIAAEVNRDSDIEEALKIASAPDSGLIVMPGSFTAVHRAHIIALAARFRIPAIYPYRYFVDDGGLLSYGVDVLDLFRRAADYVDRILRGANPAELPVQGPGKFELVINLKTARALGVVIPRILIAGADALIE